MAKDRSIKAVIYAILGLIFLVVIGSGAMIMASLEATDQDADIIDALGRQRMLSQAMGKSALGYDADLLKFKTLKNQARTLDTYITQVRAVYTKYVVSAARKSKMIISMEPESEPHAAVPFPATYTRIVNSLFAEQRDITGLDVSVDIISDTPVNMLKGFNTENDDRAWEFLKNNTDEIYYEPIEQEEKLYLLFYTTDKATVEACVTCHNNYNPNYTFKIGDVLGIRKYRMLFNENIEAGKAELNPTLDEYEQAKKVFGQTLAAMKAGGKFPTNIQMSAFRAIDGIEDQAIQEKLGEVEVKFMQLTTNATKLAESEVDVSNGQIRRAIIAQSNELRILSNDVVQLYTERARVNLKDIKIAVTFSGILVLIIIFVAIYIFNREVIKPITAITDTIHLIERDSDLRTRIEAGNERNEVGRAVTAFNNMLGKFQSIVTNMARSAEKLSSATTELSATTNQNTGQARTQQNMVAEVVGGVEEINHAISDIAQNAVEVTRTSEETKKQASESGKTIDQGVIAISELSNHSNKIGGILHVIQDIAKKTDLLAINAAIEAANAGQQGQGFAVVADEVRKLAERTTQATTEISKIIKNIQSFTSDAVVSMKSSSEAMGKIINDTSRVNDMVDQIASSAESQAKFVNSAVENVHIIKQLSEGFANAASQTQSVAEDINAQSNYLQNMVDQFKIDEDD